MGTIRAAAAALDLERAGGLSAEPRAGGGAVQAPIVRTTGSTRRRRSRRGPIPVGMLDEFQLDNGKQSRKAVPDGTPDEGFGHVVILVPVDVAAAHDGAPRQFRMRARGASSRRRLASEMISRHRVTAWKVRQSSAKASNSIPATKERASVPLSRMSRRAWRVRSESLDRLALRLGPDVRLEPGAVGDIDLDGEQTADEVGQYDILEDTDRRFGIKLDQEVDVAGWPGLAANDRAEQRSVAMTCSRSMPGV